MKCKICGNEFSFHKKDTSGLGPALAKFFDKMQEKVDVDKGLQKKDTIALGKLLLEIELVNKFSKPKFLSKRLCSN